MMALAAQVVRNKPDLVLFVCDMLVGNNGVDQVCMFDWTLQIGGHWRRIDGIMLTKLDTVSDELGAALMMTYVNGVPVVFWGTA